MNLPRVREYYNSSRSNERVIKRLAKVRMCLRDSIDIIRHTGVEKIIMLHGGFTWTLRCKGGVLCIWSTVTHSYYYY